MEEFFLNHWLDIVTTILGLITLNEVLGESVTLRGNGNYIVYAAYKL